MPKSNLKPGDRIGYSAKFLRNTGDFSKASADRRGTFLGYDPLLTSYACVLWDDIEDLIASGQGQYADPEYCDEVRRYGSVVHPDNIARIGSARHALNDV